MSQNIEISEPNAMDSEYKLVSDIRLTYISVKLTEAFGFATIVCPLHIRVHILSDMNLTIFLELSYAKPETVAGFSELKSTAMFIKRSFLISAPKDLTSLRRH